MVFYDCCPQSPYPTLLYSISFQRSSDYYTFKLVLPSVVLTVLSFIAFFMDPDTGERSHGPSSHSHTPPGWVSVRRNTKDMHTERAVHRSDGCAGHGQASGWASASR